MTRWAIPDTLARHTRLLSLEPPLWQGAVVCPDHVPEQARRRYQAAWGDWLRAHPDKSCWPLWMPGYVEAQRHARAKADAARQPVLVEPAHELAA